eukprot:SAG31_NODE_3236_length_4509_cov_2.012472_2_plen_743_part_00
MQQLHTSLGESNGPLPRKSASSDAHPSSLTVMSEPLHSPAEASATNPSAGDIRPQTTKVHSVVPDIVLNLPLTPAGCGISVEVIDDDVFVSSVSSEVAEQGVDVGDTVLKIAHIQQGRGQSGLEEAMEAIDESIAMADPNLPAIEWNFAVKGEGVDTLVGKLDEDENERRIEAATHLQKTWRGYVQREDLAVNHLSAMEIQAAFREFRERKTKFVKSVEEPAARQKRGDEDKEQIDTETVRAPTFTNQVDSVYKKPVSDPVYTRSGNNSESTSCSSVILKGPNGAILTLDGTSSIAMLGRGLLGLPDLPKIHRQHVRVQLNDGTVTAQKVGKNPAYFTTKAEGVFKIKPAPAWTVLSDGDVIFCARKHDSHAVLIEMNHSDFTQMDFITACIEGNLDTVKSLLKNRVQDINFVDDVCCSPIWYAAGLGHAAIVDVLAANGAAVDAPCAGSTPIAVAAIEGCTEVVATLIKHGADIDQKDDDNASPFYLACAQDKTETAAELANAGAEIDAVDTHGCTPCFAACAAGNNQILRLLIERGADIKRANTVGCTPLRVAAENGHLAIVKTLLGSALIDPTKTGSDAGGQTAEEAATSHGHTEVAAFLRQAASAWQRKSHLNNMVLQKKRTVLERNISPSILCDKFSPPARSPPRSPNQPILHDSYVTDDNLDEAMYDQKYAGRHSLEEAEARTLNTRDSQSRYPPSVAQTHFTVKQCHLINQPNSLELSVQDSGLVSIAAYLPLFC